jgi:hypothetical protein
VRVSNLPNWFWLLRQEEGRGDVLPIHVYHILLQSRASHGGYTTREQLVDAWLVEERSTEQDPADLLEGRKLDAATSSMPP